MSARRAERLIDLLLLLLHGRLPLPWSEIRILPAYSPTGRDQASVQRQFERDKEDLRALGVPIEYVEPLDEESEGGYLLDRRRYFLPAVEFTEDEALALALAEGLASRMAQALGEDAFAAWTKLFCLPGLPTAVRGDVARRIHLAPAVSPVPRERVLVETIRDAIDSGRRLRLTYRTLGAEAAAERVVDPYGLLIRQGTPYLIAYDHKRRTVLTFRISRIEDALPAPAQPGGGADFSVPASFSLESFTQRAPWEFGSQPPVEIVVKVAPRLALQVERTLGRRAAVKREKDGAIVVRFSASDTAAAIRWVLSFGRAAEIIAPAAIRTAARETLQAIAARHTGTAPHEAPRSAPREAPRSGPRAGPRAAPRAVPRKAPSKVSRRVPTRTVVTEDR